MLIYAIDDEPKMLRLLHNARMNKKQEIMTKRRLIAALAAATMIVRTCFLYWLRKRIIVRVRT